MSQKKLLKDTMCPRRSDPFYIVSYYIKWVTTSWTHSNLVDVRIQIEKNIFVFSFNRLGQPLHKSIHIKSCTFCNNSSGIILSINFCTLAFYRIYFLFVTVYILDFPPSTLPSLYESSGKTCHYLWPGWGNNLVVLTK